jgi:iron complex transport system substrate-binding protein
MRLVISGKRKLVAIALVAVLVVAIAAIALSMKGGETSQLATVVDASNTSVSLNKTPEKIVSCSPAVTEMVYALGLGSKVVAVTSYDDFPAEAKALRDAGKVIGGFKNPSSEAILNYTPDLVLLEAGAPGHDDLAVQLRDSGVPVLVLYSQESLEDVYKCIDLLGKATGTQSASDNLISGMKSEISSIEAKVANENAPNVMFVIYTSSSFTSTWVAGGNTAIDQIINKSGGSNAFGDLDGFKTPSQEQMISRASTVDYIIMTTMYADWSPEGMSSLLKNDPLWSQSPAVKNNKVFYLTGQAESIFNRQSVRMVDAVQLLAEILHPDSFANKVPFNATGINQIGDEYTTYIGKGTAAQTTMISVMTSVSRD